MHAVVDSERKARNSVAESWHKYRHNTMSGANFQARHSHLVGSVNKLDVQMGKRLMTSEFMRKLRKLNSDLVLRPHPQVMNPLTPWLHNTANLYLRIGDHEEHLMPFELDWMPEWSTMDTTKVKKPYVANNDYWPETEVPRREVRRGWRTVLMRLVKKHILLLDAVEREFGVGHRKSWAQLKQSVVPEI